LAVLQVEDTVVEIKAISEIVRITIVRDRIGTVTGETEKTDHISRSFLDFYNKWNFNIVF